MFFGLRITDEAVHFILQNASKDGGDNSGLALGADERAIVVWVGQ